MNKDKIIAELRAENAALRGLLEEALKRLAELESQIKTNSRNSSKPPSSDGLNKKPAFPRPKGGPKGGRYGHKGNTLKFVDTPDSCLVHEPSEVVCECGCQLSKSAVSEEKRQVFDLPQRLLEVTQHRIGVKSCESCGKNYKGSFPSDVVSPTQYGKRVRALVSLLNVEQSLPVGRIKELFSALTGYGLNENTIQSSVQRMSEDLKPAIKVIKESLLKAELAHADETGARIAGKLHWVHNLVTQKHTYFFVDRKRGAKAFENENGITKNFTGTLVHDCWSSYFNLKCTDHGLCGAHLLRELNWLAENQHRTWAKDMHSLLMYAYQFSDYGRGVLPIAKLKVVRTKYSSILAEADKEEPLPVKKARGRPKQSKGRNLMNRMKTYEEQVLNFVKRTEVPFTNNLAERDLRPWKTKLKVSGCFRTISGARQYANIKSFCSTVKKNGLSVYEQLVCAIDGKSFLSAAT